ncbi:MAG: hemolysin, partial [Planctomycetes bacterium]|nr:hemolysin [Planctomycetota bacterium]
EQIGPTEYRVAGDLSIREWNELFQAEADFPGFDTIGGLVLLLLGHIPEEGESVEFGQLSLTVETMRKRKIETILLKTRNPATN